MRHHQPLTCSTCTTGGLFLVIMVLRIKNKKKSGTTDNYAEKPDHPLQREHSILSWHEHIIGIGCKLKRALNTIKAEAGQKWRGN